MSEHIESVVCRIAMGTWNSLFPDGFPSSVSICFSVFILWLERCFYRLASHCFRYMV